MRRRRCAVLVLVIVTSCAPPERSEVALVLPEAVASAGTPATDGRAATSTTAAPPAPAADPRGPAAIVAPECVGQSASEPCTVLCGRDVPDQPCLPSTGGVDLDLLSVSEYESVQVPPGSFGVIVDVYFDQRRTQADMAARCEAMSGVLRQRADDGSPWAGWWYCVNVDAELGVPADGE